MLSPSITSFRWLITINLILYTLLIHALPPRSRDPEDLDRRDERKGLRSQKSAPFNLAAISRSKSKGSRFTAPHTYEYDESAGRGSVVYIIDSGFDTKTPEYKSLSPEPRWIITRNSLPAGASVERDDPDGHGTCIGSLVSSPKYGVAKGVSLVIVKAPYLHVWPDEETPDHIKHFIFTLWDVVEDMKTLLKDKPHLKGRLFVNFSAGFTLKASDELSSQQMNEVKSAFKAMDELSMIYAALGNRRPSQKRDSPTSDFENDAEYPERWRDELPHTTFVGMADQGGRRSRKSKIPSAGSQALWAVAQNVKCAPLHGQALKERTGTSLATPQAAGLAAYAAGLPDKPFPLSNPRKDFDGYVADLQGILEMSSWKLSGGKKEDKELLVPLISNQFCEEMEGKSSGCACM